MIPSTPSPLPPDRSHIATEGRNLRSRDLHALTVEGCVDLINREDLAIHEAMRRAAPSLAALISAIEPRFLAGGRLIYVGAGTSGRLGVLDASEAPPTFQLEPGRIVGIIAGGDAALRRSSERLEDDPLGARPDLEALNLNDRDSVLGITAGGTTAFAVGALSLSKSISAGVLTALLTCAHVPPPPHCDHTVLLDTGPEILTGSTRMKAGTATKLALNTISTTLMIRSGKVYQNLMVDLRASNHKLRDRAARIIQTLTGLTRPAAFDLLDQAGGSVKAAIAMHRLAIGPDEAVARLNAAGGKLHILLESTPETRS